MIAEMPVPTVTEKRSLISPASGRVRSKTKVIGTANIQSPRTVMGPTLSATLHVVYPVIFPEVTYEIEPDQPYQTDAEIAQEYANLIASLPEEDSEFDEFDLPLL